MDVFFITYDEPLKEQFWEQILEKIPSAQRVDGVKGFSRAHRECALRSGTERFFTIDGDSIINEKFSQLRIKEDLLQSPYVLSWSSKNSVNGLAYGNGGVKNWPRSLMLNIKTHEDADGEDATVDFCFTADYYQMPEVLSTSFINATPLQAFRAGFREGMKMGLDRGKKISETPKDLPKALVDRVHVSNLERLRIWCSVGADTENGLWAIYGARLGLHELYLKNAPLENIRDYDWFNAYWKELTHNFDFRNSRHLLAPRIEELGRDLQKTLQLSMILMDPDASSFFKSVYFNRPRQGLMFT